MTKIVMTALTAVLFLLSACSEVPPENKTGKRITDAYGREIVFEKQPERIIILHSTYLEFFFALGTPPAASTGASVGNAMHAIKTWQTLKPYAGKADVIDLGSARDINIEAVLAANPDVIVTFKGHTDRIYDRLVQIAPVVHVNYEASWQEQTRLCAQVAGKEKEAEALIGDVEKSIADAKNTLAAHKDKTLAIFRTDGKTFISRGNKAYYETFGITKPSGFPDEYGQVSLESIAQMNPYFIVFQDRLENAEAFIDSQNRFAVWRSLDAVKNGRIYYFDESLNTFGPLAMKITAENLVKVFTSGSSL